MHRHRPTPPTPPPPRSFVGWVSYLEATISDDGEPTMWATAEEAEEALEAEYGVVPMAEFFDFGGQTLGEIPAEDDDDDGGASVLRVLR